MAQSDIYDVAKYLIDAVSTSHWAEVILLLVILVVLGGGGYLLHSKIASNERLMMRLFDMLGFKLKAPPSETEKEDGDKPN